MSPDSQNSKTSERRPCQALKLGDQPLGFEGRVVEINAVGLKSGLGAEEIERRLIELGFIEGARVKIMHQGLFGRDPIAVRIHHSTVALRREEAHAICVEALEASR